MVFTFNTEGHTLPHVPCRTSYQPCHYMLAHYSWFLSIAPSFSCLQGTVFRSDVLVEWKFCHDALMDKSMDHHNFF